MSKIQFNSKDAKGFRTICEKYYNAQHTIADLVNKRNDAINRYQSMLDDANDDLNAIANGEYKGHREQSAIEQDVVDFTARIADAKADYDKAKSDYDKAVDAGLVLYTDTMHECAENVVSEFGSEDSILAWRKALAESLVANGVKDATSDNVARFDFLVMAKTNSAKKVYKSASLIGVGGKAQSAKLFCNALVEYLCADGIIKPFAHKYIPVSERNKKNK